jgi:hypothetical protein
MALDLPIEEFVSGGYFLAQPFTPHPETRPQYFPADLVQAPVITVSPCLAEVLPDDCVIDIGWTRYPPLRTEDRAEVAADWGIAAEAIDDVARWSAGQHRHGRLLHDDAFADVDVAREFARRFLSSTTEVKLLGIGLHRSLVADFLDTVQQRREIAPGHVGAPNGVRDGVARGGALAAGGRPLGFEVLDVAFGESRHSWHCHGLEREMHDRLGVDLLPGGLIERYEDAVRIAESCDSPELGCESGVWRAWVVVEYDR